jgi:hypothetical protein
VLQKRHVKIDYIFGEKGEVEVKENLVTEIVS